MNYYNENDKKAAQWLRNLIEGGMVPPGDVDDRSIENVRASDLRGYIQCHFFAGIGGWSEALRLASWPTTRPVWTGSCPCQSFSSAGQQKGFDDPRHLWPVWFNLIKECKPSVVFGEQVEAAIAHGWLDLVQDDLERQGYTCGAAVLPACSVGAPHIRKRLWFMAYSNIKRWERWESVKCANKELAGAGGLAISLGNSKCDARRGATNGYWGNAEWLYCRDEKHRPIEPRTLPLVNGIPNRVVKIRGYGNAIVPQVAAEVIKVGIEYLEECAV